MFLSARSDPGHWAAQCCNCTANLYLMLGAFLASGMNRINEGQAIYLKRFLGVPSNETAAVALSGIQRRLPWDI